ncbi:MAG TPA: hypothetical protein VIQ00_06170 [Chitinophagaceae bacterium]
MEKRNETSKNRVKKGVPAKPVKVAFRSDPQTSKLVKAGRAATANAIRASRALGLPITYMQDGNLYREFADGTKEVIVSTPAKKETAKKITPPLRKGMVLHARK